MGDDNNKNHNNLLLTLKSWPDVDTQETSLSTFIPRIQAQRGGTFKDVNEEILLEEVKLENQDAKDARDTLLSSSFSPPPREGGEDNSLDIVPAVHDEKRALAKQKSEDDNSKEALAAKRMQLIQTVEQAHHEAMYALDFVSLLLSSVRPVAAELSMSRVLKEHVSVGTLGGEKVRPKPVEESKDLKVTQGWKSEALQSAADSLLNAAKRLNSEVDREVRYWDEILGVKNAGWAVCRLPRDSLGVKYGFAEAGAEYSDKGIGALVKTSDGSVVMEELNQSESSGKVVHVQVIRNGKVTGTSRVDPPAIATTTTDMIERARDSVYENELFFEITREARTLANLGVRTSEDSICIDFSEDAFVLIEMTSPLDESGEKSTGPDVDLAQGISIALRVLLSHSHRQNLERRRQPPAPISSRRPQSNRLALIRPVASHLSHRQHVDSFNEFLAHLVSLPRSAGFNAQFVSKRCKNCFDLERLDTLDTAVGVFLGRLESEAAILLPGNWKVTVVLQTYLDAPGHGTRYTTTTAHDGSCATLMGSNTFGSATETERYLQWCLERSIVNEIQSMNLGWSQIAMSNDLSKAGERSQYKRLCVEVEKNMSVRWTTGTARDKTFSWDGGKCVKTMHDLLQEI